MVSSSKNEREDRFLVTLRFTRKLTIKKFAQHWFVSETFYKNQISQKLKNISKFFKNWLVVCTLSFYTKGIVANQINSIQLQFF